MSNTNHLCRNLLAKGLKDQKGMKKMQLSSPQRAHRELKAKIGKSHPKLEF